MSMPLLGFYLRDFEAQSQGIANRSVACFMVADETLLPEDKAFFILQRGYTCNGIAMASCD